MRRTTPAVRHVPRVPFPVELVRGGDPRPRFLGYGSNISETGLFVQCCNPRAVGSQLEVLIHLPGPRQAISLSDAMFLSGRGVYVPTLNISLLAALGWLAFAVLAGGAIARWLNAGRFAKFAAWFGISVVALMALVFASVPVERTPHAARWQGVPHHPERPAGLAHPRCEHLPRAGPRRRPVEALDRRVGGAHQGFERVILHRKPPRLHAVRRNLAGHSCIVEPWASNRCCSSPSWA